MWEGMFLDEDAPPRREGAVCVDCPSKLNSYNAAYSIRCYRCQNQWNLKCDELCAELSWERFGSITSRNTKKFDQKIIDFIDQLKAKSTGIYYGDAFQELSDRTGRAYDNLRARSRKLVRQGRLIRPRDDNKMWATPESEYHNVEQLELIMDDKVEEAAKLRGKSKYPNVFWNNGMNKWMAVYYDREEYPGQERKQNSKSGTIRNLGYADTEEEAYEIVLGFLEMRERSKKKEEDEVEVEPTGDDLMLLFEEEEIYA